MKNRLDHGVQWGPLGFNFSGSHCTEKVSGNDLFIGFALGSNKSLGLLEPGEDPGKGPGWVPGNASATLSGILSGSNDGSCWNPETIPKILSYSSIKMKIIKNQKCLMICVCFDMFCRIVPTSH